MNGCLVALTSALLFAFQVLISTMFNTLFFPSSVPASCSLEVALLLLFLSHFIHCLRCCALVDDSFPSRKLFSRLVFLFLFLFLFSSLASALGRLLGSLFFLFMQDLAASSSSLGLLLLFLFLHWLLSLPFRYTFCSQPHSASVIFCCHCCLTSSLLSRPLS